MSIVPDKILDAVITTLREPSASFMSERPSCDQLRCIIEAVFGASLTREEGKAALVAVQLSECKPNTCSLAKIPCTSHSLRKLSPFCDSERNWIYCNSQLDLVGVGPLNGFCLTVHAERPGVVVVALLDNVIAVLDESEWHIVNGSKDTLDALLQRAFVEDYHANRRRISILIALAMAAWRAQRGAIFAMVDAENLEGLTPPQYKVVSFDIIDHVLASWKDLDNPTSQHRYDLKLNEQNRQSASSLATLFANVAAVGAGVDGVTMLDRSNLRLLGFGAKICAPDDGSDVLIIDLNREPARGKKAFLGGMRHQSAARLVAANHQSTVLTVSQDGAMSIYRWTHEGVVAVVRHVDRLLRAPSVMRTELGTALW